mgnify:CR=1 FL=1
MGDSEIKEEIKEQNNHRRKQKMLQRKKVFFRI